MLNEKTRNQTKPNGFMPLRMASRGVMQRKCACGTHTMGGGQCAECQKNKLGVGGQLLQPKLTISSPGDVYEQEADRVAEQVMRMSDAQVNWSRGKAQTQLVQRRAMSSGTAVMEAPPIVHEVLNLPGQPLDIATRAFFEPRFGHDFSQVRVHADPMADMSVTAVNALAYTVGPHIVFGTSAYKPETVQGQRLLAHELAHVLQQHGSPRITSHGVKRGNDLLAGSPGSTAQADRVEMPRSCDRASPKAGSTGVLQRAESGNTHDLEAGAVGSVQFCLDLCSGDYRIVGWVWGGAGKRIWKTFVGPSFMYEGEIHKGKLSGMPHFNCGRCDEQCESHEGGVDFGVPLFRDIFKGNNERPILKLGELECGALLIPHNTCNISLEFICFLNLIKYMGPVGQSLGTLADKIGAEAKAGIDGGATLELCRDKKGDWVIPKAEVCLGGFIEFGWGVELPKQRSKPSSGKPGNHPVPQKPSAPTPSTPTPQTVDPRLVS